MQHMAEMVAEHRFAGGAHSKALFQRVRTACSDPGNFGGKAVYQLALLFQQAFGDQHRHGHVFVAGCLKAAIQNFLDVLPDCIAIGAQHNKALDAGIFNQLCLGADIRIPLREINFLRGDCFDHFFLSFAIGSPHTFLQNCMLPCRITAYALPHRQPHRPRCGNFRSPRPGSRPRTRQTG